MFFWVYNKSIKDGSHKIPNPLGGEED